MGWMVSVMLAFAVMVVMWMVGKKLKKSNEREALLVSKILLLAAPVVFVLWAGIHTAVNMAYQIPAGHTGVVYEFGEIKTQVGEGLQTVAPWRDVKVANIQVQGHQFKHLNSFSQETQDVFVDATLNIRVSPVAIQGLYRDVGPNFFDVLVAPRVAQNFKDETVKYKSVDIAPHRENIRHAVSERLKKELAPYSIEVMDLLLDDIDFQPGFKQAIESKQIATQRALEEEQKVLVEKYRAEQALERAKGEGNSLLAVAEKQAEANKKLSESLTPTLVQYAMIQKLSDKIQVLILPSGQNFILDSEVLKGMKEKESHEKK